MDVAKRECILDAAIRAFSKLGFRKTSVDEIARDAGVAKGTVYLACDSKEDLFFQSVHRELRAWVAEGAKRIDPRRPADELLVELSVWGVTQLDARPLVRDLFAGMASGALPGWSDRFEELRAIGRSNVEELLRLGQKQGRFRPELDVEAAAHVLQLWQQVGYIERVRTGQTNERHMRQQTAALDIVLNGLRAAGPARKAGG